MGSIFNPPSPPALPPVQPLPKPPSASRQIVARARIKNPKGTSCN
jgi:hypothetical protein